MSGPGQGQARARGHTSCHRRGLTFNRDRRRRNGVRPNQPTRRQQIMCKRISNSRDRKHRELLSSSNHTGIGFRFSSSMEARHKYFLSDGSGNDFTVGL